MSNMANMMPSGRLAYMKKLVEGGTEQLIPPSKEEIAEWKGVYLSYFNSDLSAKHGRMLPKKLCIKNPRPDEVTRALNSLGIRSIFEAVSMTVSIKSFPIYLAQKKTL